jgi:titin
VLVGPLNVFGTVTGGSTVFTGVPPAAKLVAIPVATSTVSLTWIDVSDLEEGFRIERSPNGQGMWTEIGSVPADTEMFIDYTATPLVVFDYRVIAFNSVEDAAPSNVASAVTPAPGQPQPPGGGEPPKKVLDFLSPGVYGLERDDQNGDTGFRF